MQRQRTFLLVDDDEDDLILIQEAIAALDKDYAFAIARDGRSALNYLKEAQAQSTLPCLLILDINMPVLDGREVLAIIKSQEALSDLPIVVFTTSANPSDLKYCKQFNVELITKPFDMAQYTHLAKKFIDYCNGS